MKAVLKLICILLTLGSLVLLLLPCWNVDGESISASEYILHPEDYRPLTKQLQDITGERKLITRNVLPIFILMMVSVVSTVVGLIQFKLSIPYGCVALTGSVGCFVYLSNSIIRTGALALTGLILSIVQFVLGVGLLIYFYVTRKENR